MIRHYFLFRLALLILVATVLGQAGTNGQVRASSDVVLVVRTAKQVTLGEDVFLTVVLSSQKNQELTSLETATLEFQLEKLAPDGKKKSTCGHALLDNTRVVATRLRNGQELIDTIILPREHVAVSAGQQITRALKFSEVFERLFGPGEYILTATYEGQLAAEARFTVVVDDKESVPALIDLIEKGDFETKVWARNSLFIITGKPPWSPARTDDPRRIKEEVQTLRSWWLEHKSLIKVSNQQLETDGAKESSEQRGRESFQGQRRE